MRTRDSACAERVTDEAGRRRVVEVLRATYQEEKRWIVDPDSQIPPSDLDRADIAWFVVSENGRPAGALRVLFDPPLAQYARYRLKLVDPALDVEAFIRHNRIAEIGRFAVVPDCRGHFMLAAALMRTATQETVERGYTHFVTDVFEDDVHSPLGFHTRVMGFFPVATHDTGELACSSRRITLVLDLKAAYQRLRGQGNWLYRYLTLQWDPSLHERLVA